MDNNETLKWQSDSEQSDDEDFDYVVSQELAEMQAAFKQVLIDLPKVSEEDQREDERRAMAMFGESEGEIKRNKAFAKKSLKAKITAYMAPDDQLVDQNQNSSLN